jgi:hypothetical protein
MNKEPFSFGYYIHFNLLNVGSPTPFGVRNNWAHQPLGFFRFFVCIVACTLGSTIGCYILFCFKN